MRQLLLEIGRMLLVGGLGTATLLYGQRYLWLSAGVVGFATAAAVIDLVALAAPAAPSVERELLVGLLAASVCGAITWWLPRIASVVIGFGVGVYGIVALLAVTAIALPSWAVVLLAVAAGIIGARYATWDTDQALIICSVLLGASMVVRVLPLSRQSPLSGILWLCLLLIGIVVQYSARLRAAEPATAQLPDA